MTLRTAESRYPLNEPQRRSLSITLASVERDVMRLREWLQRPPTDGVLARYTEPLPHDHTDEIGRLVAQIEQEIHRIAEDLALAPQEEPMRRTILAALVFADIAIDEVKPRNLRGFGEVDEATVEYLHRVLPPLQASLTQLVRLLDSQAFVERVVMDNKHDSSTHGQT